VPSSKAVTRKQDKEPRYAYKRKAPDREQEEYEREVDYPPGHDAHKGRVVGDSVTLRL
jgi:hypothetical protein